MRLIPISLSPILQGVDSVMKLSLPPCQQKTCHHIEFDPTPPQHRIGHHAIALPPRQCCPPSPGTGRSTTGNGYHPTKRQGGATTAPREYLCPHPTPAAARRAVAANRRSAPTPGDSLSTTSGSCCRRTATVASHFTTAPATTGTTESGSVAAKQQYTEKWTGGDSTTTTAVTDTGTTVRSQAGKITTLPLRKFHGEPPCQRRRRCPERGSEDAAIADEGALAA